MSTAPSASTDEDSRTRRWSRRDPHELRNVVHAERYQEIFHNLKEELRAQRAKYGDRTGRAMPK